jgi:hypothetical protein
MLFGLFFSFLSLNIVIISVNYQYLLKHFEKCAALKLAALGSRLVGLAAKAGTDCWGSWEDAQIVLVVFLEVLAHGAAPLVDTLIRV